METWKRQLKYIKGGDQRHASPELGMRSRELAKLLLVSVSTIDHWLQGHRHPRAPMQAAIAALYRREVKRREG